MSARHTPGPWVLDCLPNGSFVVYVEPVDDMAWGKTIASRWQWEANTAESLANARLIAAAPELLEAAKLVLAWYEAEDNHAGTDFYQRIQMCRDSEAAVRAAIAAATGGQQ